MGKTHQIMPVNIIVKTKINIILTIVLEIFAVTFFQYKLYY